MDSLTRFLRATNDVNDVPLKFYFFTLSYCFFIFLSFERVKLLVTLIRRCLWHCDTVPLSSLSCLGLGMFASRPESSRKIRILELFHTSLPPEHIIYWSCSTPHYHLNILYTAIYKLFHNSLPPEHFIYCFIQVVPQLTTT